MDLLAQYVMNGVMLGLMYALVALGFTLFFGVLDVVQFAHGDVLDRRGHSSVSPATRRWSRREWTLRCPS